MDSTDVATKYHALFLIRFQTQGDRGGLLTAEWLNVWVSPSPKANLPHIQATPQALEYICIYFHERVYRSPETGRNRAGF